MSTVDFTVRFGPEKHRRDINVRFTTTQFVLAVVALDLVLVIAAVLLAVLFVNVYLAA